MKTDNIDDQLHDLVVLFIKLMKAMESNGGTNTHNWTNPNALSKNNNPPC